MNNEQSQGKTATIWSFINSTDDRFCWTASAIKSFAATVHQVGRSLGLQLQLEFDRSLGAEILAYPLLLLNDLARKIAKEPATSDGLFFLLQDLASEIQPGKSSTFQPSAILKRAIQIKPKGLVVAGEMADSPSLRSRVGRALAGAEGKRFGDLELSLRGRNRHRKYIVWRRPEI
jgi:hypothetical protein